MPETCNTFILSASRRTDVPAFYAEWFLRRLAAGGAEYLHPYTRERIVVPLSPDRVAAIVFWTKNFAPLLPRLPDLEAAGHHRFLVHYTITGLGPNWEPRTPETSAAVETLKKLSDRIGPDRIYWRFDPMVFTERITVTQTLKRFEDLCARLKGRVTRCYTSVMVPYKKIEKRIQRYELTHRDPVRVPTGEELAHLSYYLAEIARAAKITVHACCAPELQGFGVQPGRCLDAGLIASLWPETGLAADPGPTRKHCNCHRAIDLGAYDTCPHRCLYCYANLSDQLITNRFIKHDPDHTSLLE